MRNNPFPTQQDIADYYATKAAGGNYSSAIAAFDSQRADVYRRSVLQLLPAIPGGLRGRSVLDVGCFTGLSLDVIEQLGGDAYGLEYQPAAAAQAEAKHPGRVRVGDISSSPPDFDRCFDVVTMTDVIEHVPDPMRALRGVHGLLAANGRLLITTPNSASLVARGLGAHWPLLSPVHHLHLFDRRNLSQLLRRCGFESIEIRSLWKSYSLEYIAWIMPNFNPRLAALCAGIPKPLRRFVLPLNGGEMLAIARRSG